MTIGIRYNLGASIAKLFQTFPVVDTTTEYVKGKLIKTVLPPRTIQALVMPRAITTAFGGGTEVSFFEENSDRVEGSIKIYTAAELFVTRQDRQASIITYKDNEYFVLKISDWTEWGYSLYLGELIIDDLTG